MAAGCACTSRLPASRSGAFATTTAASHRPRPSAGSRRSKVWRGRGTRPTSARKLVDEGDHLTRVKAVKKATKRVAAENTFAACLRRLAQERSPAREVDAGLPRGSRSQPSQPPVGARSAAGGRNHGGDCRAALAEDRAQRPGHGEEGPPAVALDPRSCGGGWLDRRQSDSRAAAAKGRWRTDPPPGDTGEGWRRRDPAGGGQGGGGEGRSTVRICWPFSPRSGSARSSERRGTKWTCNRPFGRFRAIG